ncbi:hypothetical protein J4212_05960 [Candidatus Woesearchaeota archaeon]|nr:hypothetical protein [Candidatus Woesearchaeota archaeon]
MRVALEQDYLDISRRIAGKVNAKYGQGRGSKLGSRKLEKLIFSTNTTIEKKKERLMGALEDSLTSGLSFNHQKAGKKELEKVKECMSVSRAMVLRLRSINHYMQENLLFELGLKKRLDIPTEKSAGETKAALNIRDINRLEHSAYIMIQNIITLDKKLLGSYAQKERIIEAKKEVGIKSLGSVLAKESELMMHLESKLPPSAKVTGKMLQKSTLGHWVPRVLALLSALAHLHAKEKAVFAKIAARKSLREKLSVKIMQIQKEKGQMLMIREKKAHSMKKLRIDREWREAFHSFNNAQGV